MDLRMHFLSFFVIQSQTERDSDASFKAFKHYQTLNADEYEDSAIKSFLDDEFVRIIKRKVEKYQQSSNPPTKIGTFMVQPGYELSSNMNYHLFQRIREATDKERFHALSDELIRLYMDTSAVRGGAFIVSTATWNTYFNEPFLFILKCDFEPKIATISDEVQLIKQVDMAISAKTIKSIQYPHMSEEGMLEHWELKINQASHARYFEDFLKYVSYEKSIPEAVNEQVVEMVQTFIEQKWEPQQEHERAKAEQTIEVWAAKDKRELQHFWSPQEVIEAQQVLVEQKEDIPLQFKVDDVLIKGLLAQFAQSIHIAQHNGKYVAIIEGDQLQFEKGMSPVELLTPPHLMDILPYIASDGSGAENQQLQPPVSAQSEEEDDLPPW